MPIKPTGRVFSALNKHPLSPPKTSSSSPISFSRSAKKGWMTSSLSFESFGSGRGFLAAGEKTVRLGRPDSGFFGLKPRQRQAVKACLIANIQQKSLNPFLSLKEESCKRKQEYLPIYPETLDEWMNESITEIVRNVGDAPLLMDIYSKKGTTKTRIEKEKAKDSWPLIRRRWKEESCMPDGLVLVEQLKDEDDETVDESGSRLKFP